MNGEELWSLWYKLVELIYRYGAGEALRQGLFPEPRLSAHDKIDDNEAIRILFDKYDRYVSKKDQDEQRILKALKDELVKHLFKSELYQTIPYII